METGTQTHFKALREWLSYRQRELQAEVHAAALARQAQPGTEAHAVVDQKDIAEDRQRTEMAATQTQRDIDELAEVQTALQRLDRGSYGDCADCGEAIPLARLVAQPAALRCAPCQSRREHSVGSPHHGHVA